VWLAPAPPRGDACDQEFVCEGTFLPSDSKTDNFKVQPTGEPDGGAD
jgi:hypothetical protein